MIPFLSQWHSKAVKAGFELRYGRSELMKRLRELEASQWLPEEQVRAIQWGKLKALIRHAYSNVPYYRSVMDSTDLTPDTINSPEEYAKLPMVSKAELNAHREEMIASNYPREGLIKTASGGSTGVPVTLYHDPEMVASYRAVKLRNFSWAGWQPGDAWVRLWGSAFDVAPHQAAKQRIVDSLSRVMVLPCFEMSDKSMDRFSRSLERFRPALIEAYVTPMYLFARYIQGTGRAAIRPRAIICSAEMLFEHQRALIEEVFGCKVFNRYGGREMGDIAHECEAGSMHLNAETTYAEFIKDGRAAEPGEAGEIVLTALDMCGMPLLRYRVEDVGRPSDLKCMCGRGLPTMEMVEGRVQDIISLPSGRYLPGEFFPHLFKDYPIEQFQVVQETLERLIVKVVPAKDLTEEHVLHLTRMIKEYTGEGTQLEFSLVDKIPLTSSGKFRYTISCVPLQLTQAMVGRVAGGDGKAGD